MSEPSFGVMARTAWPTLNQVSGQSVYVAELAVAVEGILDIIKPLIEQKKYLRNLFDKASRCVQQRTLETNVEHNHCSYQPGAHQVYKYHGKESTVERHRG